MNNQHSYDVLVIGAGAAGVTAAMQAQAEGASVLVLEKSTYEERGGNSKVSGQIVFWPNNIEKAQQYFKAMAEPYTDFLTPEMIKVWAQEMHANRGWLEALGMDVHHVQSIVLLWDAHPIAINARQSTRLWGGLWDIDFLL